MSDLSTDQFCIYVMAMALNKKHLLFWKLKAYLKPNDIIRHSNSLKLMMQPTF